MLRAQIQHHRTEINMLQDQMTREFDAGVARGRSRRFEEAMGMATLAAPENHEGRARRPPRNPDEEEAENLRRTVRESRRNTQPPMLESTPGARTARPSTPPLVTMTMRWCSSKRVDTNTLTLQQ